MLNLYAAKHFPNIGGLEKQVSVRGKCKEIKGDTESIKIFNCRTPTQIGTTVVKHIEHCSPEDVYIISPMSINSYGNDVTVMRIQSQLSAAEASSEGMNVSGPQAKWRKVESLTSSKSKSKSKYKIQTSMTLKGGEAYTVCLFGLDKTYNLDHFARNRQLKLLYVALSRAKSMIKVYIDYGMLQPPLLHLALEGSLLTCRFSTEATSKYSGVALQDELKLAVGCYGMNKENCGGLSKCFFDVELRSEGSVRCSLGLNMFVYLGDVFTHLISKALVFAGVTAFLRGIKNSQVPNVARSAIKNMDYLLAEKNRKSWELTRSILTTEDHLSSLNSIAIRFGFATCICLLQMCAMAVDRSHKWLFEMMLGDLEDICPDQESAVTKSQFSLMMEKIDDLKKFMQLEDYDISARFDEKVAVTFTGFQSSESTFKLDGLVDMILQIKKVGSMDRAISMTVVICSNEPVIKSNVLTRSALCASMCGAEYGVALKSQTGMYAMSKAIPMEQVSCMTKCLILTSCAGNMGIKTVPVMKVPKISQVTSIAILHAYRPPRNGSREKLCVLLMCHYSLETMNLWMLPTDESDDFGQIVVARKVNDWLNAKVSRNSVLYVSVGKRTQRVLGDLATGEYSTSFKELCSSMVEPTKKGNARVASILSRPNDSELQWCKEILKDSCADFKDKLEEQSYYDTCIGAACVIKSLLNWDTVV